VGHHHARVGVGGEQRGQRRQVGRRLEHPAPLRAALLEVLEEVAVELVGGREIAARIPGGVARHLVPPHQLFAAKGMRRDLDALDGDARAQLVQHAIRRHDVVPELHLEPSAGDAFLVVAVRLARRWAGVANLPVQRGAMGRVLRQQLVQDRGAGARARR